MYSKCLVVHPKDLFEEVMKVLTHTRDKGDFLVSLSQVFYKILNDPE